MRAHLLRVEWENVTCRGLYILTISASAALTTLAGCSSSPDDAAQPGLTSAQTMSSASPSPLAPSSSPQNTQIQESEKAEETTTQQESEDGVAEVAERFATLIPASLFEKFDSCNPSGLKNSYQCTGPEVGQFQFFENSSKAASTTQLLTELRSSRVVEDDGNRVVGWSTLGSTAVITVVDNETSQIMQQMVSADEDDPEQKIRELGVLSSDDEKDGAKTSSAETTSGAPSSQVSSSPTSSSTTQSGKMSDSGADRDQD